MIALQLTGIQTALIASVLLGICCGALGTFVVVRRMALTGDMLSHAVLPGVVAGLMIDRNPLIVLGCALIAGVLGTLIMHGIERSTKLKPDAALGIVLTVFFAIGVALISGAEKQPTGVMAYMYGQAAAIDTRDLLLLGVLTVIVVIVVTLGFRVLRMVCFDGGFARLLGWKVVWIERGFYFLLSASIVISMQAVGVILVTAMLITPAVAAGRLTQRLGRMVWYACLIGAAGAALGAWISGMKEGLPTGPLMALSVTGLFIVAGLFGPRDGWLVRAWGQIGQRRRIARENLLKAIYHRLEADHFSTDTVGIESLARELRVTVEEVRHRVSALVRSGAGAWSGDRSGVRFSDVGRRRAEEVVRNHRLWERYLFERAAYAADHVHDDAERVEHWISEENVVALKKSLKVADEDPHGKPIPGVAPRREDG